MNEKNECKFCGKVIGDIISNVCPRCIPLLKLPEGLTFVKELPKNMTGHILVFADPLIVYQKREVRGKDGWCHMEETGKVAKCYFMRSEGGFGSYECCSGRMIIGKFFETIQDVKDNKPFDKGNTKCYPDGYIPELFTEHEKLS